MIKPKSIKKLADNTLLVEVTKTIYSDLLLEQKSFVILEWKPTQPHNSLKSPFLPLHLR